MSKHKSADQKLHINPAVRGRSKVKKSVNPNLSTEPVPNPGTNFQNQYR